MMKYRIVKMNNGKYAVQEKWNWFYWYTNYILHDTIEDAKKSIDLYKAWEKEKEERSALKILEVVE